MTTWLVCKNCQIKEALLATSPTFLKGCEVCGDARFAEDDEGRPMILWSVPQDPNDFNPSGGKRL